MDSNIEHQETFEKVRELVKNIDSAMLTTVAEDGLIARPMQTQKIEADGTLWFLTKKDTDKFHELLRHKQVNVSYAGKSFISIRGEAELVEDVDKVKEFWSPVYEKMLETSYDDPNLVLIKVRAEAAEYWDVGNPFKSAKYLFRRLLGRNTEGTELNKTVELVSE